MSHNHESYHDYIMRLIREEKARLEDPIENILHRLQIHIYKVEELGMHTTASVMYEAIETIEKLRGKAE